MGAHITTGGQFQSDKYPTCPPGKVPLSVRDATAQDLLWEYAQRRESVDAEFSQDLRLALVQEGYAAPEQAVYRFDAYFGRMGSLEGLFVSTADEVERTIGKRVDFGECLGKHSEVALVIEPKHIQLVTASPLAVAFVNQHLGGSQGHNPVRTYAESDEGFEDDGEED